jgi:hypothetical protein
LPAKYIVAPPSAHDAVPPTNAARRTAVFIAHGMGQQIPFETIASIADGLRTAQAASTAPPVARSVQFDGTWMHRVELMLKGVDSQDVETHVYEGYWAPLTEGKITVRNVITFLTNAARNAIRNSEAGRFDRMMFGTVEKLPIAVRTIVYLAGALFTVLALVVMNSTIAVVSAGRALLSETPSWLSNGLFLDLTTTFNFVIAVMALFGIALGLSSRFKDWGVSAGARAGFSYVMVGGFIVTLAVVMLAGFAIPFLFYGHVQGSVQPGESMLAGIFPSAGAFNKQFELVAWGLAILIGGGLVLLRIFKMAQGIVRDFQQDGGVTSLFMVGIGALILTVAILLGIQLYFAMQLPEARLLSGGLSWALLVAASAMIRKLLVQFVGDVAIYVAPYHVDQFYELRSEIKECVLSVARRVYKMKDKSGKPYYDRVLLVSHSLGTVVTYDALNALIRDEESKAIDTPVIARTPLFLTFGSPLDKIAFIFAGQATTKDGAVEAREALAVTKQPMIADYKYRPARWVNIWSKWDIICGSLDLFDSASAPHPTKKVDNKEDPDATTLLSAHTEYWRPGSLLFTELLGAV